MNSASSIRTWYTPVEVSTLRRWLIVSFLVNVLLLSIDVLRGGQHLHLALLGLALMGTLLNVLPEEANPTNRTLSILLGGALLLVGLIRLLNLPHHGVRSLDASMDDWPGGTYPALGLRQAGNGMVVEDLSLSAIEYGLARNERLDGKLRSFGAHLVLLHFVVLTLLPLVWILDIALSPETPLEARSAVLTPQNIFRKCWGVRRFGHGCAIR